MYGALLVNRQKRIDAASKISRIHFRMQELDHEKVRLQVEVAKNTTVKELRDKVKVANPNTNYIAIPYRHDPAGAIDARMGDPLSLAEQPAEAKTATARTNKKKKEIG